MNTQTKHSFFDWFIKRPKTSGLVVSLLLSLLVGTIAAQRYEMLRESDKREMYESLETAHRNLEQSLKNCYTTTFTMALTITDSGVPENFESVAATLLESNPVISAVELVPGGVITYVYPTIGNEKAIGFDILRSPDHRKETLKSMQQGKMYFAGPLKLQQGGIGIVGRLPVYFHGKFWGFSAVVIQPETLYRFAGLGLHEESNYYFQLTKNNPVTGKREFLLSKAKDFNSKLHFSKAIPEGGWELFIIEKTPYGSILPVLPVVFFGLILAMLCGFALYMVLEKPAQVIRQSEARFESLFNDSPVALWEEDFSKAKLYLDKLGLIGAEPEIALNYFRMHPETVEECLELVTILNVNRECVRLHYPKLKSELVGKNLAAIIGTESRNAFIKQLVAVTMELSQTTMDTQMTMSQGETRELFLQWTVMSGYEESLGRVVVSTEDITERKQSEEIIFRSRQRIESLIDTIDGIVWESDFDSDNITFVNKKAQGLTGYPLEEWVTEKDFWTKHIHHDDRAHALRSYHDNVSQHNQFEFEYRFVKKDGGIIWVRDYVNVVKENGKPIYVRGIMLDVTKEKRAEEKLNESLKLVIEQNKRLQNFSYIVSHNLRSHTSNIQSIVALMETVESEVERGQMIKMLRTVSNSLNETMINLNEVVNIQTNISLVSENLNLRHYIDGTLQLLSEQIAQKEVRIHDFVPQDAEILFNPAYLESILLNLISNAIRYSCLERQPEIHLKWYVENGRKSLEVADNGIGIDLEKYGDKIFGMYKTFSNNPDSRGIGLFITKNQIDAMGGSISVNSEPDRGTTFRIEFN